MRSLLSAGVAALVLAVPSGVAAQGNPEPHSFKFNTGQGLTPIFEGWAKNPDGTFSMYFGYYNRNYVETLVVPVGNDNKIEGGTGSTLDRGQPTVFNPRIRRNQFSVVVPKDFGKKELTWSVTVRGVTEKAVAWLQPEWEIDPIWGGKTLTAEMKQNKAPQLTLDATAAGTTQSALALTAAVQDDGLPKPRGRRTAAIGQETPPALKPDPNQPEIPVNVPSLGGAARGRGPGGAGQAGPTVNVNWYAWRGPAPVTFDNATTPVRDGKAVTNVTFSKPGTYVLRARASDGELNTEKDVTVTVK